MVRRTITLALVGLAVAAPPALADHHHAQWHSQMKEAVDTASRTPGGCTLQAGWHQSLLVNCHGAHTATVVYVFPVGSSGGVKGTPTSEASWWGRANVHRTVRISGNTLRVTVTVGNGSAQLNSVSVGYYA
jgi:hypothetical protein